MMSESEFTEEIPLTPFKKGERLHLNFSPFNKGGWGDFFTRDAGASGLHSHAAHGNEEKEIISFLR